MSWSLHLKANAGDDQHVGRDVSAATDARICDTKDARVSQSMPSSERGQILTKACHFPVSVSTNPSQRLSKIEIMERGIFFFFFLSGIKCTPPSA